MVKRKQVISFTHRKNSQGGCVVLITKDEGGTEKEEFLFGPPSAKIKSPGVYDITYAQNRMGFAKPIDAKLVKKSVG